MREVCQGSSPSLSSRSPPAPAHPNIYITPGLAWPGLAWPGPGSGLDTQTTTGPGERGGLTGWLAGYPAISLVISTPINRSSFNVALIL